MSDDLDLRGIDHRHEPDTQFRAALQRRVAAIVAGTDPGSVTEARDLAVIDLEPTSANPAPRRNRRRVVQVILAAAVVVAIALVATRDDDATPADQPSPTVTVPPTVPPRSLPKSGSSDLVAGTYFVDEVAGTPTPRIFFTVGAGWYDPMSGVDSLVLNHGVGVVAFSRPDKVYADACHQADGFHAGPVDTVDGLVAALTEQDGWAEVSAPSEISVDGYSGKAFQRTAPFEFSDCEPLVGAGGTRLSRGAVTQHRFGSWEGAGYEPGETETLWVLDIDGTVVLITTGVWPGPSSAARADVAAAVLESIRIDRSSPPNAVASEPAASTPAILPVGGPQVSAGPLAPDLGQFTDPATVIDALIASGPLENQLLSDPNLRPGVSICAHIVQYHEPTVGTLVHVANAMLNGQRAVVLVFKQPSGSNEVHMYETDDDDPTTSGCILLLRDALHPGPATNPVLSS